METTTNNYPTLASRVCSILKANGYLGFDSMGEAARAILDHDDWTNRWEVPFQDQVAIFQWRKARLAGRKTI